MNHHAKGSSARSIADRKAVLGSTRLGAVLLVTVAFALLALATSASAARPFDSSFGSFTAGQSPESLTVDQSNGDVYAFDTVYPGKIARFDSAGNPKNFTAGPDAGTNTLSLSGASPSAPRSPGSPSTAPAAPPTATSTSPR